MNITEVANRGFNVMVTAVLGLGGLTFGSVFFQEPDLGDKVDDGGFLIIAALVVIWYLFRGNRFAKSIVPVLFAGAAVAVQILGLVIERDDPKAFGDNIGGMLYFGATLLLVVVQYRLLRAVPQS